VRVYVLVVMLLLLSLVCFFLAEWRKHCIRAARRRAGRDDQGAALPADAEAPAAVEELVGTRPADAPVPAVVATAASSATAAAAVDADSCSRLCRSPSWTRWSHKKILSYFNVHEADARGVGAVLRIDESTDTEYTEYTE
jgi:hypothetical protein